VHLVIFIKEVRLFQLLAKLVDDLNMCVGGYLDDLKVFSNVRVVQSQDFVRLPLLLKLLLLCGCLVKLVFNLTLQRFYVILERDPTNSQVLKSHF
jgi:hypothetical protein